MIQNTGFSFSTTMNGFNVSMEQLSSFPSTARNLTCVRNTSSAIELWFDGSDDQTLHRRCQLILPQSVLSVQCYCDNHRRDTVLLWQLQSLHDANRQSVGPRYHRLPIRWPLRRFVVLGLRKSTEHRLPWNGQYRLSSTALSMALAACSSAMSQNLGGRAFDIPITVYNVLFTSRYEIYILILHIVVSIIMLIIVASLRLASRLRPDFINSTRLLLDPLKKPELFNAPLRTTVDTLAEPVHAGRAEIDNRGRGTDRKFKVYLAETLAEPIRSNLVTMPSRGCNHYTIRLY